MCVSNKFQVLWRLKSNSKIRHVGENQHEKKLIKRTTFGRWWNELKSRKMWRPNFEERTKWSCNPVSPLFSPNFCLRNSTQNGWRIYAQAYLKVTLGGGKFTLTTLSRCCCWCQSHLHRKESKFHVRWPLARVSDIFSRRKRVLQFQIWAGGFHVRNLPRADWKAYMMMVSVCIKRLSTSCNCKENWVSAVLTKKFLLLPLLWEPSCCIYLFSSNKSAINLAVNKWKERPLFAKK